MTFLKSLFGESFKTTFTRELFKHRIARHPAESLAAHDIRTAEELPLRRLQATPEAVIVDIVERYGVYLRHAVPPEQALLKIEELRGEFGRGAMPMPPALDSYAAYRVGVEKIEGPAMSTEEVEFCLASAKRLYQVE